MAGKVLPIYYTWGMCVLRGVPHLKLNLVLTTFFVINAGQCDVTLLYLETPKEGHKTIGARNNDLDELDKRHRVKNGLNLKMT